jgi:2-polyprenyl-3-methyl-5-hydroxy-6-metoxy-1,4-benzoquinol methylase
VNLLYRHAQFPDHPELVRIVGRASASLHEKLAHLDPDRLDLTDYTRAYLRRHQGKLRTHLQKFAWVLSWGLARVDKPLGQTTLLEYGGGCGILSLLARECGVGTVVYNDIYDVACVDAETIAQATKNRADQYICGDITDVIESLRGTPLSYDAVVSSDVIEHIYDIGSFFEALPALSRGQLSVAMSTHANTHNPVVRRELTRGQLRVELETRDYEPGHKKRDSLRSYLDIRREIVGECSDTLPPGEIEELAVRTRGRTDADVRSAVFTYLETGTLPDPPAHPTNTCDPLTGNWQDRFIEPSEIVGRFSRAGFDVEVSPGRYGTPDGRLKQTAATVLDCLISMFPGEGLKLAPFFLVHGSGDMALRTKVTPAEVTPLLASASGTRSV